MPLINGSESLVSRTALAEQLVAYGAVPFKAPTPTVETKFRVLLTGSDDDELALILIPPVGRIGNGHSEDSALSTSDTPQWAFTELPVPKFTLVEDAASLSVNFRSIPTANDCRYKYRDAGIEPCAFCPATPISDDRRADEVSGRA
jgi:hypothetical protein